MELPDLVKACDLFVKFRSFQFEERQVLSSQIFIIGHPWAGWPRRAIWKRSGFWSRSVALMSSRRTASGDGRHWPGQLIMAIWKRSNFWCRKPAPMSSRRRTGARRRRIWRRSGYEKAGFWIENGARPWGCGWRDGAQIPDCKPPSHISCIQLACSCSQLLLLEFELYIDWEELHPFI